MFMCAIGIVGYFYKFKEFFPTLYQKIIPKFMSFLVLFSVLGFLFIVNPIIHAAVGWLLKSQPWIEML